MFKAFKEQALAPLRKFKNRKSEGGQYGAIAGFLWGFFVATFISAIVLLFKWGWNEPFLKYAMLIGLITGCVLGGIGYLAAYNLTDVAGKAAASSVGIPPQAYDAAVTAADMGAIDALESVADSAEGYVSRSIEEPVLARPEQQYRSRPRMREAPRPRNVPRSAPESYRSPRRRSMRRRGD